MLSFRSSVCLADFLGVTIPATLFGFGSSFSPHINTFYSFCLPFIHHLSLFLLQLFVQECWDASGRCLTLTMTAASLPAVDPNKAQHQGSSPRTPEQPQSLQKSSWDCYPSHQTSVSHPPTTLHTSPPDIRISSLGIWNRGFKETR